MLKKDAIIDGYIGKFRVVEYKPKYSTYTTNTKAECPNCGTLSEFGYLVPETKRCRVCKTYVFDQVKEARLPHAVKDIVGSTEGDFVIVSADAENKVGKCKNGIEKKFKRNTKLKSCNCHKCNQNKNYTSCEFAYLWRKIRNSEGLGWASYYEFELWVRESIKSDKTKIHLKRIDDSKSYTPDNVWIASSSQAFHFTKWLEVIPKQDNIRLVGEEGKYLLFECDRGHNFKRLKGRISVRSNKEGYTIQCEHCKNEDAAKRAAVPKQVRLTIQEQITRDTPSITLVSDNKAWDDSVGRFECSECSTGFTMTMHEFRSKTVCPICKPEKWGKFCDSEIERKFGGKIIRTGVWTRCDVPTTWKCLKHGTHFKKTYDKVKASQSGGCPDCIEFSVPDPDAPTTLYYVRLKYDNTHFYKIGITQRTVYTRFDGEVAKKNLHVVKEWVYPTWREAFDAEQKVINAYRGELLCRGERPLRKTESTEIFYHDVLELDHAHKNH